MEERQNTGIEELYRGAVNEEHRRRLDFFTADNKNTSFFKFVNHTSGKEFSGEMNNKEANRLRKA